MIAHNCDNILTDLQLCISIGILLPFILSFLQGSQNAMYDPHLLQFIFRTTLCGRLGSVRAWLAQDCPVSVMDE